MNIKDIAKEAKITPIHNHPLFPSQKVLCGICTRYNATNIDLASLCMYINANSDIEEFAKKFENEIRRTALIVDKCRSKQLMIGSDPEFLLLAGDGSRYYPAKNFIDDPHWKNPCGLDGFTDVGELRPKPSLDPISHVLEIKKCVDYLKHVPIKATAGSGARQNRPIGGHLHFNIPPFIQVVIALEEYLGRPLKRYSNRANVGRFGRPFDVEVKKWGFEYRSLPSFITSKELAEMVCVTGYCIVDMFRMDELLVPNSENFNIMIEMYSSYSAQLKAYKENVYDGCWVKYYNDDLVAAWS